MFVTIPRIQLQREIEEFEAQQNRDILATQIRSQSIRIPDDDDLDRSFDFGTMKF